MKIKIIRGHPRKTEHGIYHDQEHEIIPVNHTFTSAGSIHITTIPLQQHIHPCYKDQIPCYKGGYYTLRAKDKIGPDC